jgi:hypothetical protein
MTTKNTATVFDYRALRLLIGLIALTLPFFVSLISSSPLASISASYYTEARDAFVGALFVVSAFLWAYNGHSLNEAMASKIASLAAISIAIFPTACDVCETDLISSIHYGAAATLFAILAYFCFKPFRQNTKGKEGKKGRRSKIYYVCGWIMVGCILFMLATQITLPAETIKALSVTYWAELIALVAFGIAWIVAGKILPPLVDKSEALQLFGR